MNFYPEFLKWPGVEIVDLDGLDLMHCELGGESLKHILKFLRLFPKYKQNIETRDIWTLLSEWIQKRLKGANIRPFVTEATF